MSIHSLIDQVDRSYHTITRYKQILDKMVKYGLVVNSGDQGYVIKQSGDQIIELIEQIKTQHTLKKISYNYKLDFYSTIKALHNQNIILLNDNQYKVITEQIVKYKKQRDNPTYEKYQQSQLTLQQIRDELEQSITSPNKLVLMLYSFIPPRRLEYRTLIVRYGKAPQDNQNYLQVNKTKIKLVLRDYKGSDQKSEEVIDLSQTIPIKEINKYKKMLVQEIYGYLTKYNIKNNDYLFVNDKNEVMSQPSFTQFIQSASQQVLGEVLGVNHLRHLFISTYRTYNNITHSDLEFISNFMCHSQDMQDQYFVLDMAKKSIVQKKELIDLDTDQFKSVGKYNVYKDQHTGNYMLVQ